MLNVVQTSGVIVAVLVSAYAVAATEKSRRLDNRRARVEGVLAGIVALAEAGIIAQEVKGQGAQFEVGKLKLKAELALVGVSGFEHTDLMVRSTATPADVVAQSEQAFLEVGARLEELAPRALWRRQARVDFRARAR